MRPAYRVLAYLIAAEVAIQAAVIVFAMFGLVSWVDDGGVLDKAAVESESLEFEGVVGFMLHAMNGLMVIPLLGLLLLVVSPFARIPGGVKWAAAVLGLIVAQVLLGLFAHEITSLGMLHGLNAFLLFGAALMAGHRARVPSQVEAEGASEPILS